PSMRSHSGCGSGSARTRVATSGPSLSSPRSRVHASKPAPSTSALQAIIPSVYEADAASSIHRTRILLHPSFPCIPRLSACRFSTGLRPGPQSEAARFELSLDAVTGLVVGTQLIHEVTEGHVALHAVTRIGQHDIEG